MVFRVTIWLGSEAGVAGVAVVIPNAAASAGVVVYHCVAALYVSLSFRADYIS
jgi:hypothetical protein